MEMREIYTLLYRHPLFEMAQPDSPGNVSVLDVLILGGGEAALAFLDACLQSGQMAGYRLKIRLGCEQPESLRRAYCEERPALSAFIDIDGSMANSDDPPYAWLSFFPFFTPSRNAIIDAVFEEGAQIPYLFAALGDDGANETAANLCGELAQELALPCRTLALARRGGVAVRGSDGVIAPLRELDWDEFDRMAFNAHLSWAGFVRQDMDELRRSFALPYNRLSSQAYVLSLKYQLKSVGLSLENPDETAKSFSEHVLKGRDSVLFDRMAAMEQRRWLMEKLCLGWRGSFDPAHPTRPALFERIVQRGSVKDPAAKEHPCILRSSESSPLRAMSPANWDGDSLPKELDELDSFSLHLHRHLRDRRKELLLAYEQGKLQELNAVCDRCEAAGGAMEQESRRLRFCVQQVLKGSSAYARQFDWFCRRLLDVTPRDAGWEALLDALRLRLFAAIEADLYRSYKANNEELIRSIPFILSNRPGQKLVMAFEVPDSLPAVNDRIFSNLASAVVLKPSQLHYLVYLSGARRQYLFLRMLSPSLDHLRRCHIGCRVALTVCVSSEKQRTQLTQRLQEFQTQWPELSFDVYLAQGEAKALPLLLQACREGDAELFDGSTRLFSSGAVNADFVGAVRTALPYFEFNYESKRFLNRSGCDWLAFVRDESYLRIDDMLALLGSGRQSYQYSEYSDRYEALWDLYFHSRGNDRAPTRTWNLLCNQLNDCYADFLTAKGIRWEKSQDFETLLAAENPALASFDCAAVLNKNMYRDKLLLELSSLGCVKLRLDAAGKLVSLRIPEGRWRVLLSKAGMLLEVYAFHKIFETGYFDDIAWGYSFDWADGHVDNEMDLMLTKGFRSVLVECKGTEVLRQDYYHKLSSLADLFGIGAKKVIIANTSSSKENRMQIRRGEEMDIVTLCSQQDLDQLGQRMKDVMEGHR